ncbi:MAG: alpha-ketoglutarate-dependent dioxygenase AlkB [Acidimicrobiales bacterium]|nr:alpha-ketoglutarate-dependent dioxygenase AlkB [Acidimicrobiales bacterium]
METLLSVTAAGLQGTLFGAGPLRLAPLGSETTTPLDDDCLVDHLPNWLHGADDLFVELSDLLPWQSHNRWIGDREVTEPRLSTTIEVPSAAMRTMGAALTSYYGRGFTASWANLYRDGRDSVAWHGDRNRPGSLHEDVALVSVGGSRTLRVRPRGGGTSAGWTMGAGDLLVMRGPTQQRFEHCVPKASGASPRISIAFRCPRGREFDQTVRPGPNGLRRVESRR